MSCHWTHHWFWFRSLKQDAGYFVFHSFPSLGLVLVFHFLLINGSFAYLMESYKDKPKIEAWTVTVGCEWLGKEYKAPVLCLMLLSRLLEL